MATPDEIISQAMTLYYRWAHPDGLRSDTGASTMIRLFELLREYDEEATTKIFTAAVKKRDVPDDVNAKYPMPTWPRPR